MGHKEKTDRAIIQKAEASHIAQMQALDARATGSDERSEMLCEAVHAGQAFVACEQGCVVGFAVMNYHFYGCGFIELLMVHPHMRRRGLGMQLLKACRDACRTQKLFTSTNQSNLPMQRLLAAAGFAPCGLIDGLDAGDPEVVYRYIGLPE